MKPPFDRRDFLKTAAGFGGWTVLNSLIGGRLSQAWAQSQSTDPRTYVHLYLGGGFSAQYLYLLLDPYPNQSVMLNQWCGNNWVSGAMAHTTTSLTAGGETLKMPHLWSKTIPRAVARGGGTVSMSVLLENSMFLQGIREPLNSHDFGAIWTARGELSGLSLHGMVGDKSNLVEIPLPVILAGAGYSITSNFSSKKSTMKQTYLGSNSSENPLTRLLGSVQGTPAMRAMLDRKSQFQSVHDEALAAIANDLRRVSPQGTDAILATAAGAKNLIYRDFGDLISEFNTIKAKYDYLIARCRDMTEVFSSPISPPASSPTNRLRDLDGSRRFVPNADLRTLIGSQTTPRDLANSFALAEYMVRENLTKAITVACGAVDNLQVDGAATPPAMHFDQHATGAPVALVMNTFVARCVAACLYEFQLQLRDFGKANDTFININSEFHRSPRSDGSGSDHGWDAQCTWGLSDAIRRPFCIGNIQLNSALTPGYEGYAGSWGRAMRVQHEGSPNTYLDPRHYASTICAVLRVPSTTPNAIGVVTESSSGIVEIIERTKVKDEP